MWKDYGCGVLLLMVLDVCCRPYAEKYEQDEDAFFKDYTAAHIKLSELGVEWQGEPFTLEPEGDDAPGLEKELDRVL